MSQIGVKPEAVRLPGCFTFKAKEVCTGAGCPFPNDFCLWREVDGEEESSMRATFVDNVPGAMKMEGGVSRHR